ncbi:MAG: EpsG family protein [Duncaniella sp.]|nr:EpsG family protein [Duncaniella sp.]
MPPITLHIFLIVTAVLVVPYSLMLMNTSGDTLAVGEKNKGDYRWTLLLSILLALWIGTRPTDAIGMGYGDSINYDRSYELMAANDLSLSTAVLGSEWLWQLMMIVCIQCSLDVSSFFLIVAIGYVMTATWAMKKILPTRPYLGFLFLISSLMYYSFSVNGLRNGLACHMILLAMAFFMDDRWSVAALIAFLAIGIHRSVLLPIVAVLAAWKLIRKPRYAIYFWLLCIVMSLYGGDLFMNYLASLGYDDRMATYTSGDLADHRDMFSATGFRWDFLAYSAVPIALTWLVNILRKKRDGWFNIISVTYILCNAFWVLVIRAEYSNRFAYLSWFLYPVVIAYPFCNMKAWRNQNYVAGLTLLLYFSFTFIMDTLYWGG